MEKERSWGDKGGLPAGSTKGVSVDEEEDIHYKRAGEKRRDSKIDRRPTETLQKY